MKDVEMLKRNGVNVDGGLELFGDIETYNSSLVDFLNEIDTKLSNIKKNKEEMDMVNYAIYTHSLKSDSKYFGFTLLAELAYSHELESKAKNVDYINSNYDSLMKEANRIVSVIKEYMGSSSEVEVLDIDTNNYKTILVVDDSDIVKNFIQRIFVDGYRVLVADDGNDAINIIEKDIDNKIVAMFLDLNMPKVDGFAVLEYFKNYDLFKKIPVSIITGEDSSESIRRVFTYPIIDVFKKPFNESEVKRMVDKTVNNNEY